MMVLTSYRQLTLISRLNNVVNEQYQFQVSALEALKAHDHNLLCNLLTDEDIKVEVDKEYKEEKYKTLLHLAVDLEDLVR